MSTPKWYHRVLRYATPAVVLIQLLLVWLGVLDLGQAVVIALGIEVLLFGVLLYLLVRAGARYRQRRGHRGGTRAEAFWAAAAELLPGPVARLARHEAAVLGTYWLLVRGRYDVPAGAVAFGYGKQQAPMFYSLAVLSVVEVALFRWLIPWPWMEILLGVLAVYGAVWLIGLYQGFRRYPHYLTDQELVLRCGIFGVARIPLSDVVAVKEQFQATGSRSFTVEKNRITVTPSGMTDVVLDLAENSVVQAKGRKVRGATVLAGCDDPARFVAHLTQTLNSDPTAKRHR